MPFDGVNYDAAPFVWPNHASPGAPVDSVVVASSLEVGYFAARRQNQLLLSEAGAWNGQRPTSTLGGGFAVVSSSFVRWSDNYVFISEGATHLRAHVVYAALPVADCTAHFRLGTYGSSDTSFATPLYGTEATQPVNATTDSGLAERFTKVFGAVPGSDFSVGALSEENAVYEADIEYAFGAASPGYNTRVFVEGYLLGALSASFRPLFTTVWWEIRD